MVSTKAISFALVYFILSCLAIQARASIIVSSHSGSSNWWLAYAINDPSVTDIEVKDSGVYSSWVLLGKTDWGYWIFPTSGSAVTFPVSFRFSAGGAQITVPNVFTSSAAGQSVDTKFSFPGTSAPSTPTSAPTTRPTTAPTTRPTQAATQAPTRPATQAPTQAATQAPTRPATQAPTQAATQAPTRPATQAPTQAATQAPTRPATQAPTQAPTRPATQAPTQPAVTGGNPFSGTQYYLNPHYLQEVDSSIADYPAKSAKFTKVKDFASAYWIDRMAVIDNIFSTVLTQARLQSAKSGKRVMAALVIYDLPARDCAALASNGEIACADAECAAGIATYKTGYIDKIMVVLRQFPDVTIVTVVEPDSLPNLATNLNVAKCSLAQKAYKTGVAYAIQQLSTLSHVNIYIDAAHGGWLGWADGRAKAVDVFAEVLSNAGGASKIRGFATNVANYQPLGSMTDTADPCNLGGQYNFGTNEVKYVSLLEASLVAKGITGMRYIIDTGRNGVINARTDCSNWCNINKAGLGVPPTSNTASSGLANIDAYFWVKPPGEGDGTSDSSAVRFDAHCRSSDSVVPAPEAGNWFSSYFAMLVDNANPSL